MTLQPSPGWLLVGGGQRTELLPAAKPTEFCSLGSGPVRSVPLAESGKGGRTMSACEPSVQIAIEPSLMSSIPHRYLDTVSLTLYLLKGWSRSYALAHSLCRPRLA
jgi:hypothetical protein